VSPMVSLACVAQHNGASPAPMQSPAWDIPHCPNDQGAAGLTVSSSRGSASTLPPAKAALPSLSAAYCRRGSSAPTTLPTADLLFPSRAARGLAASFVLELPAGLRSGRAFSTVTG
jgi:hypothetical protein